MGWLAELLLESPVPPPRWLPDRNSRRARARDIVRRILAGQGRHPAWHAGHTMVDLTVMGGYGSARTVSGQEIQDAVENQLTHLNPPIVQGWSMAAAVGVCVATLFILRGAFLAQRSADLGFGFELLAAIMGAWLLVSPAIGWNERELELCDHGVAVRRWTDIWFHRPGRILGLPTTLVAVVHPNALILSGPDSLAAVSLRLWPASARMAIHDELEGCEVNFGHRPGDSHHRRKNHREEA